MRSFFTKTLLTMSAALSAAGVANAQSSYNGYYQPSLLPVPAASYSYPAMTPVAMNRRVQDQAPQIAGPSLQADTQDYVPSPSDMYAAPQAEMYSSPSTGNCSSCQNGGTIGSGYLSNGSTGYDTYGYDGYGVAGCGCGWFGGVGGLVMTRDADDTRWFSYDTGDFSNVLLSNRHADMNWGGGFEARLGKYFNCNQNAIEMVYWGLYPGSQQASAYDPDGTPFTANDISSTLDFRTLDINGTPVFDWYDQATVHRISRDWEFHNVELNLLGGSCGWNMPCYGTSCGGNALRFNWLAGVRYFRFREGFEFASSETNADWDYDTDDVFYNIDVTNNLIGFQLGGKFNYCLTDCVSAYAGTKVGVYGNHISHRSRVGTATDAAVINDPGQIVHGEAFDIRSSRNDVAMVGEIDLGMTYQLTCHWSLYGGYRAVALTGVALTLDQIPHDFEDIHGVADVKSNGSMILHGAYAGAMFCY